MRPDQSLRKPAEAATFSLVISERWPRSPRGVSLDSELEILFRMGQNITAIKKRKRRRAYLKRRKERLKELIKGAKQGKKEAPAK